MKYHILTLAALLSLSATVGSATESTGSNDHTEHQRHLTETMMHPTEAKSDIQREKHRKENTEDLMSQDEDRYDNRHYKG
ncbi:MAG: hypothetical protein EOP52_13595 [Sphingobacteriales bacterium]|nr:MAG: hypothetical protein EOP52_13595 [Sphingobacteriales bacterium]